MYGPGGGIINAPSPSGTNDGFRGIVPRCAQEVFNEAEGRTPYSDASVAVSLCEIYCDRIRDLGKAYAHRGDKTTHTADAKVLTLKTSELHQVAVKSRGGFGANDPHSIQQLYAHENLELHEDHKGTVYVKGLTVIPVQSVPEVLSIIETGFKLRATHDTRMNNVSSRSHTIFTFHITQKDRGTGQSTTAQLHLVDLAGSERLSKSESTGQRLVEAQSINLSLASLGKVVVSLATVDPEEGTHSSHIPYRDSKLTRLLQNSLGGNAYTTLIATIHPRMSDLEESISTLQFANRCQTVLNRPKVNYLFPGAEDVAKRLRQLEAEMAITRRDFIKHRLSSAIRLMRLLAEAGINGSLLPDGKFRTENGIIVGLSTDEAEVHPYVIRALALLAPEPSEEDVDLYKAGQETKAKILMEMMSSGSTSRNSSSTHQPGAPMTDEAIERAVQLAISGMATAGGVIGAGNLSGATAILNPGSSNKGGANTPVGTSSNSNPVANTPNSNMVSAPIAPASDIPVMMQQPTVGTNTAVDTTGNHNRSTPTGANTNGFNGINAASARAQTAPLGTVRGNIGGGQLLNNSVPNHHGGNISSSHVPSVHPVPGSTNISSLSPMATTGGGIPYISSNNIPGHSTHKGPLPTNSTNMIMNNVGNNNNTMITNAIPTSNTNKGTVNTMAMNGAVHNNSMGSMSSSMGTVITSTTPRSFTNTNNTNHHAFTGIESSLHVVTTNEQHAFPVNNNNNTPSNIHSGVSSFGGSNNTSPFTRPPLLRAAEGSHITQTMISPEQYTAEVTKLKGRINELKRELDQAKQKAETDVARLTTLAKAATEKSDKAQAEAAEAIRAAKESIIKSNDEHAKQVTSLLLNSNKILTEQERLATSTPRHLIPVLLKSGNTDTKESEFHHHGGTTHLSSPRGHHGSSKHGSIAASSSTLHSPVHFSATTDLDSLRKEYGEAVARLKMGHETDMHNYKQKMDNEITNLTNQMNEMETRFKAKVAGKKKEANDLREQVNALQNRIHQLEKALNLANADPAAKSLGITIPIAKNAFQVTGLTPTSHKSNNHNDGSSSRPSTASSTMNRLPPASPLHTHRPSTSAGSNRFSNNSNYSTNGNSSLLTNNMSAPLGQVVIDPKSGLPRSAFAVSSEAVGKRTIPDEIQFAMHSLDIAKNGQFSNKISSSSSSFNRPSTSSGTTPSSPFNTYQQHHGNGSSLAEQLNQIGTNNHQGAFRNARSGSSNHGSSNPNNNNNGYNYSLNQNSLELQEIPSEQNSNQ